MTLDDKLSLAPINENPQRILDMGIETGIWAIDFGMHQFNTLQKISNLASIQICFCHRHW
jgi:hypothetical protein